MPKRMKAVIEKSRLFYQILFSEHKVKSTLELLTKKTVNVPEWPSYSFDLNLLGNLWQNLKMVG